MKQFNREAHACAKTRSYKKFALHQGVIIGGISLFWLILKTGRKPSRINYPCQQTALANVSIFLVPPAAYLLYRFCGPPEQPIQGPQLMCRCIR